MLRQLIESHTGPLTDQEFCKLSTLVTRDIQVNHIGYGLRTSLTYAVQRAALTYPLLHEPKVFASE